MSDWKSDLRGFLAKYKDNFKPYNDMTHMRAVFVPINGGKPCLPYDEFIVDGGHHAGADGHLKEFGEHFFAKYEFPNGNKVSVICGGMFYSRIDAPYEARLNDDDPEGCLTDEELMIFLAKAIGDTK